MQLLAELLGMTLVARCAVLFFQYFQTRCTVTVGIWIPIPVAAGCTIRYNFDWFLSQAKLPIYMTAHGILNRKLCQWPWHRQIKQSEKPDLRGPTQTWIALGKLRRYQQTSQLRLFCHFRPCELAWLQSFILRSFYLFMHCRFYI